MMTNEEPKEATKNVELPFSNPEEAAQFLEVVYIPEGPWGKESQDEDFVDEESQDEDFEDEESQDEDFVDEDFVDEESQDEDFVDEDFEDEESQDEESQDEKNQTKTVEFNEKKYLSAVEQAINIALKSGLCSEETTKLLQETKGNNDLFPFVGDTCVSRGDSIIVYDPLYGINPPHGGLEFIINIKTSTEHNDNTSYYPFIVVRDVSTKSIIHSTFPRLDIEDDYCKFTLYRGYLLLHTSNHIFIVMMESEKSIVIPLNKRRDMPKYLVDNSSSPPTIISSTEEGTLTRYGDIHAEKMKRGRGFEHVVKLEEFYSIKIPVKVTGNFDNFDYGLNIHCNKAIDHEGRIWLMLSDSKGIIVLSPDFQILTTVGFSQKMVMFPWKRDEIWVTTETIGRSVYFKLSYKS